MEITKKVGKNAAKARWAYWIASSAFVFIGAAHVLTHMLALRGPMLEMALGGTVPIFGNEELIWNLWQAFSILMGSAFVALGATNIAALKAMPFGSFPPAAVCVVSMTMLAVVFVMGLLYLGPIQVVGAPCGVILFALSLHWRAKSLAAGGTTN